MQVTCLHERHKKDELGSVFCVCCDSVHYNCGESYDAYCDESCSCTVSGTVNGGFCVWRDMSFNSAGSHDAYCFK